MIEQLLENEYWYGSCVKYGQTMPLHNKSECVLDFELNGTPNQSMPLMVSSKGRYLWRDSGYSIRFAKGTFEVPDDVVLGTGYETLKGAYMAAMDAYFPFSDSVPHRNLFQKVIYNTWIELTFNQNQADVLAYAKSILASGMPPGVLMIDDGWSENYGNWSFHTGRFPDPEGMIKELKLLGFDVMLWVCPYITADTVAYRDALAKNLLIKDEKKRVFITDWWNGYSATLDMTNPDAAIWMDDQLKALMAIGIDGFKFDGGDSIHYRVNNKTYLPSTPDGLSNLWAKFGEKYAFNEYRASFKAGGYGLLQRLCDKDHSWGETGLHSLIPDALLQGITGHPYACPDMIGGGEYVNFWKAAEGALDQELFIRHCEIATLMPAIQFSADPYRVLDKENFDAILRSISFRQRHLSHLMDCIQETQTTGEPIMRYMIYEFPEEPVEQIIDQYMLGKTHLVAPVYKKNEKGRQVYLPKGKWQWHGQTIDSQGEERYFISHPGEPLVFVRF